MQKLKVIYCGWDQRWELGTLALLNGKVLFEYSAQAITKGVELSPLHFPLPNKGAASMKAFEQTRCPGFIADALPDGWGMLLMDRALDRKAHV